MCRFCFALLLPATLFCISHSVHATPADQIFPDSTKGFVSIRNLKDFGDQWKQTQFGKLLDDPLMAEFKKEVQTQLTERMEKTFGLTLDGIASIPSGEVASGLIAVPGQVPGYVLTMDVAGKRAETNAYLAKLTQKFVAAGAKRITETYKGQQITVLIFPPPRTPQTPRTLGNTRIEIKAEQRERRAYYMFQRDVLIASDQLPLLRLIADRITDPNARSLAQVEAYQVVMKRCLSDLPKETQPSVRWYMNPLDYGESVRVLFQGQATQRQRDKPSLFSTLKQQGFDAFQGIGGVISVKTEAQETVSRTFAYTKKPYRLAMQMMNLPASTNFAPPTWMPSDLARCTMLSVDPLTIFDNFGGLFDAFVGTEGVWKDVLEGLERDPRGPRINLHNEVIAHLGNRVMSMSRYEKPITIESEHFAVAVELKAGRESALQASAQKLFANDREMREIKHRSYTIWQRIPSPDAVDVPFFPEGAVVIAKGYLFVSANVNSLKAVLDRLDTQGASANVSIAQEVEYKEVNQIFAQMGLADKPHSFQFFSRIQETLHPTYEMVRQGQLAQSQAVLGKLLHEVFLPEEERKQSFNGSTLPEFEKVQHYFGKVGIYGIPEENGYFIKGFTVERTRK